MKQFFLNNNFFVSDGNWTDLRFPFTQVRQGALLKPDFDYTNVGLLFPQSDTAEIIYINAQMPHEYKLGSDIYPHIHWQQMNVNQVVWKIDYKWFCNGEAVPASFTTITSTGEEYTYSTGNLAQRSDFPAIDGSGILDISSILQFKLYRDDAVDAGAGSGDALAFEFDIHYQKNSTGSETALIK